MTITLGTTCSGIGGAEIAALLSGADYQPLFAVEFADHQRTVLSMRHDYEVLASDVYATGRDNLPTVDVYVAGFPCQPFSVAGRRAGEKDPRNLWPEIARHLDELRPRIAVLENVPALRNPHAAAVPLPEDDADEDVDVVPADAMPAYLGTVLGDLSELGYHVAFDGRSAASIGAHHRRDRLWIVAWRDVEDFDPFRDEPVPLEAREIGRWNGTVWERRDFFDAHTVMKWPRAGIVRGSVAYEVATASPGTSIGFIWPTPNAFDHVPFFGNRAEAQGRHAMSLRHAAPDALWTTAQAHDATVPDASRVGRYGSEHGGRDLNDQAAAAMWPTPLTGSLPGSPRANSAQGGIALLTDARSAMWQSPTVGDATGGRASKGKDRPDDGGLRKQLDTALYPTPTAADGDGREARTFARGNPSLELVARSMWPTSTAEDAEQSQARRERDRTLTSAGRDAMMWPTVGAADGERGPDYARMNREGSGGDDLTTTAFRSLWPTARASEFKGTGPLGSASHDHRVDRGYLDATVQEPTQRSGLLNPRWVEALMGYPPGWTDVSVPLDELLDPRCSQAAWLPDAYRVGDLPETNPDYAAYWLWHPLLGDLEIPLAPRASQTKNRLISLGNAWVPQVAAPIFRRIAEALS